MNSPTDPTGHTPGEPTEGWWKRRSRAAKIGIVVAALIVAGGIGGAFSDDGADDPEPTATAAETPTVTETEDPTTAVETTSPEEAETAPEADNFTISHDDYDLDGELPGGTTTVSFEIADNFTRGMIASGAQRATFDALEAALAKHPDTGRVVVEGTFPTVDDLGNETEDSVILRPFYDRETIDQINFDNQSAVDIWAIRDGGMVHPDLID